MFSSMRGLWSRHKRKILISLGAAGCGYLMYRFYDAQNKRIAEMEGQFEQSIEVNECNKLEEHFEIIQRVCDAKTLPNAMHYLRSRINEDLDLSHLKDKLMQGKAQTSALSKKEKLVLWQTLKVLSFTRTVTALWSMTILCLYVRVLVNILGRQLYLEIASGNSSSINELERYILQKLDSTLFRLVYRTHKEENSFSRLSQRHFLASADHLPTYGISSLIEKMQTVTNEVVKDKQLNEPFTMAQLGETIMHIFYLFISSDGPNYWISYLVPQDVTEYKQQMGVSSNGLDDPSTTDVIELELLICEARSVLASSDFANIMEISLKAVVNELIEDITNTVGGASSMSIPLAKLLPQLGLPLLNEHYCEKFVQVVQKLPEVDLFYKLLYANMPKVPP